MIEIKHLHAEVDGKEILKDFNLKVNAGEVHAIMGPNGAGKSTLAKVLSGHPSYQVISGEVWFKGQNLLELEPEERARLGLFMSFQYPVEIPGVNNRQFLFAAVKAKNETITLEEFEILLDQKMQEMGVDPQFKERNVNEGFSGGEKKKNEILQMSLLNPDLAILDETDSGLDIDAMRIVASGVKNLMNEKKGLVLITHYQRLLQFIQPDFVHVMVDGKLVQTGGKELALTLEEKGYDWLQ